MIKLKDKEGRFPSSILLPTYQWGHQACQTISKYWGCFLQSRWQFLPRSVVSGQVTHVSNIPVLKNDVLEFQKKILRPIRRKRRAKTNWHLVNECHPYFAVSRRVFHPEAQSLKTLKHTRGLNNNLMIIHWKLQIDASYRALFQGSLSGSFALYVLIQPHMLEYRKLRPSIEMIP